MITREDILEIIADCNLRLLVPVPYRPRIVVLAKDGNEDTLRSESVVDHEKAEREFRRYTAAFRDWALKNLYRYPTHAERVKEERATAI